MSHKIPVVGFVSLGCPKALVDTERIVTELRARGYRIGTSYHDADIVIVNTCGFVNEAVRESLDAITEALAENGRVIVCGCLGGRTEADGSNFIMARHPKVIGVTGPDSVDEVLAMVEGVLPRPHDPWDDLVPAAGVRLTPKHYAYLKISEGCNHHCTFCVIPHLRGSLNSRSMDSIIREAMNLKAAGVKELLVISQDTAAYGVDKRYKLDFACGRPVHTKLIDLCRELGRLDLWTRLHYVYPYPHVDDIVPLMAEGLILPYLDVPFQHAHPRILKLMKRPACGEKNLERIAAWRRACPDITIRSTFIVGFPGETAEDFEDTMKLVEKVGFDASFSFIYSPRPGTPAARLPDDTPYDVKLARLQRLQATIDANATRISESMLGTEQRVLVLGPARKGEGFLMARTDNNRIVNFEGPLSLVDTMVRVKVTDVYPHSLGGQLLD